MSRKRERQREQQKELARQLGVNGKAVPRELLDNERVTEPEMSATLTAEHVRRGWFEKAPTADVLVALYVIDVAGARLVRVLSCRGRIECAGPVALAVVGDHHTGVVRYRRPGHFVVLARLGEGASDAVVEEWRALLRDPARLRVVVGNEAHAVAAAALARETEPRAAALRASDDVPAAEVPASDGAGVVADAVCAVAAVHRVKDTVALPLVAGNGRVRCTLHLALRL